jgi:hypothetical protein
MDLSSLLFLSDFLEVSTCHFIIWFSHLGYLHLLRT